MFGQFVNARRAPEFLGQRLGGFTQRGREVLHAARYVNVRVAPGKDEALAYFGTDFGATISAKELAAGLEKVLPDIEALKAYPVKR